LFNASLVAAALAVVVLHAPKADLHLEVAQTDAQREHGLMDRTSLPPHTGMIFIFPHDGNVAFWMKDTLIPLDMVFVAADGTVRLVDSNVPSVPANTPDGNIPLEKGTAKYVIELPAGEALRDGIVAGSRLKLADVPLSAPN
jgi:uncharacterized protein